MNKGGLIYPELSYLLTGILFSTHNELGQYCREKQYGDLIEKKLKESKTNYKREITIGDSGNIIDFIIEGKILLELKAKKMVLRQDFDQTQRYLQETGLQLGLLVNFRSNYLKPIRIVKIDTKNKEKYIKN